MKLLDLLTDDDLKLAKSKAEVVRTCCALLGALCSLGSLLILVAVHIL